MPIYDATSSINLEITSNSSIILFGSKKNDAVMKIDEILNYEPETYYIFNTQEFHNILNFSGTRYLFSLDFQFKKEKLSYRDIVNLCKEEKLL